MFIDTHMHEMTYSPDSFLKLEEMVRIGKEKGLGALCITVMTVWGLRTMQQNIQRGQASRFLLG